MMGQDQGTRMPHFFLSYYIHFDGHWKGVGPLNGLVCITQQKLMYIKLPMYLLIWRIDLHKTIARAIVRSGP